MEIFNQTYPSLFISIEECEASVMDRFKKNKINSMIGKFCYFCDNLDSKKGTFGVLGSINENSAYPFVQENTGNIFHRCVVVTDINHGKRLLLEGMTEEEAKTYRL